MEKRIVVGVGGVCIDAGRFLLVRRGKEPFTGRWTIPGGSLEFGEKVKTALIREMKEETGLDVSVDEFAGIHEAIDHDRQYHFVILDYFVTKKGGILAAGDDATEAGWFSLAEVEKLETTPGLTRFLMSPGLLLPF